MIGRSGSAAFIEHSVIFCCSSGTGCVDMSVRQLFRSDTNEINSQKKKELFFDVDECL